MTILSIVCSIIIITYCVRVAIKKRCTFAIERGGSVCVLCTCFDEVGYARYVVVEADEEGEVAAGEVGDDGWLWHEVDEVLLAGGGEGGVVAR